MRKSFFIFLSFFIGLSSVFADATVIPKAGSSDDKAGLGKKFMEGTLQLYDIPYYLQYLTDLLVWLAGLLAVVVVMLAGYQYLIGGFTDSTDSAKTAIGNVVKGLVVVVFAWMILDLIVRLITE